MRYAVLLVVFTGLLSGGSAVATEQDASAPGRQTISLMDVWTALQKTGPIYAPYAFISHKDTQASQAARKKTLLHEIDNLIWRRQETGNVSVVPGLLQWRQRIDAMDGFRTPGQWGPAALLASARNGVPVTALATVGACDVPSWVEVWSAQGVQRTPWKPGLRLLSLLADNGLSGRGSADVVTIITSYGDRFERGIAAWNEHDMPVSPGMRIVVPLPIAGQVGPWLDHTIVRLLAHALPADHCRQLTIQQHTTHADD